MSTILCIDQGTSGTKAVVVDGEDRILGITEIAIRPDYRAGGIVEQDPDGAHGLGDGCRQSGGGASRRPDRRRDPHQPGGDGPGLGSGDRQAAVAVVVWQDSRAESVCDPHRRQGRPGRRAHRVGARPVLHRTQAGLAAPQRHHRRGGHHLRRLDPAPAHRRVRHGRVHGQPVAGHLAGQRRYDAELLDLFGLEGERMPRIVANDEVVGETSAFGSTVPVGGSGGGPAGGPAGRELPRRPARPSARSAPEPSS